MPLHGGIEPAPRENVKQALLISLCFSWLAVGADFQAGLDAYKRGDFAAAAQEWTPLAEAGDAHAQYNLGLLYAAGKGVPQDYKQAVEWYRKAGEQGVPAAEYNLGVIYANGQGIAADPQEAAKWFLKAAQAGIPNAVIGLGNVYYESEGGFRNYAEAEKWYRQAADHGVASAAFQLGVMYDLGQGVQQDYHEAVRWYQKAADQGYAPAMVNLGILYYNAQGEKRDLVQSLAWFHRALRFGDPRSVELMGAVQSKLRPRDIKKAEAAAAQWQPPNMTPAQAADNSHLFMPPPTTEKAVTAPASTPAAGTVDRGAPTPAAAPAAPEGTTAPGTIAPGTVAPKPRQDHENPDLWTGVSRVIAVGDVHGDYEQFAGVLQSAGLIDSHANWTGGSTHLVQIGNVVDRGPDSRAVMDLLMKLQKQAEAAGGAVHMLLGNHEAMNLYGDLRYVSPGEFASYTANPSQASHGLSYADYKGRPAEDATEGAAQPGDLARMPGYAEQRAALSPDGAYGRWLRSRNAVIKIDRTLFVHAGLGPKYADWSLDALNNEIRDELRDPGRLHGGMVTDPEGPLWFQGLAQGDEAQWEPLVSALLQNFDVDRIVIGHSFSQAITPRFGGRVVLIDIGLSRVYDNVGKVGCLEIDQDHAFALHRGHKLDLPKDEDGPDMLRYLKQAAAFDPQPSPLQPQIDALQKRP
jgi:TPR repeat protein